MRITGLSGDVARALAAALLENPPSTWELDNQRFEVSGVVCDGAAHLWTGRTTYEQLAAAQLVQGGRDQHPPERRVTLHFASPTGFKSGGMHVPRPCPVWSLAAW